MRQIQLYRYLGPLAILLSWWVADQAQLLNPFILPGPRVVLRGFSELLWSGELFEHTLQSLKRVGGGFILAALVAAPLGFALGLNQRARQLLDVPLQLLKPIPPIAWIPLAILLFGLGDGPAYCLTAIAAFFPIVFTIYAGARAIHARHFELARVHGAKPWQVWREIVWPATLPSVINGFRLGLGVAWMAVVAAEMIAAHSGLGYLIQSGQTLLQPAHVLIGMMVIGLTGWLLDRGLSFTQNRLVRWT